jgi:hypothetical protein
MNSNDNCRAEGRGGGGGGTHAAVRGPGRCVLPSRRLTYQRTAS